nr:unnamed protein product [Spirometra erinaceieuropaei]
MVLSTLCCHPPLPFPLQNLLRRLLPPPTMPKILTQSNNSLTTANTSDVDSAPTCSPCSHTVASQISLVAVTCESLAQRLANQCLEHQPKLAASAPTTLTVPRKFDRRMGLLGHMRTNEKLR